MTRKFKFLVVAAPLVLFLVNLVLPLTLSAYVLTMILCVLPLLWLSRHEGWNRSLLLLPWAVAFMASILVTRNFMYPDIETARNTDVNILELSSLKADSSKHQKVYRVNFPKHGPEDAGQRFEAIISTDIDEIMSEDVDAGFHFYDKDGNLNLNFTGSISYTVGDFSQPLNAVLNVDMQELAEQGWELKVHDMRDTVKPIICAALIFAMFIFMLIIAFTSRTVSAASSMLGVWLFFAMAMVTRLYIAMRLAYYPPLDAKYHIYLRYRSIDITDPLNNPLLATVILVVLMIVLTVFFRMMSVKTSQIDPTKAMNMFKLVLVAMIVTIILNLLKIGNVITHICLPVSLFFLAEYFCLRIESKYHLSCHFVSYVLTLIPFGIGDPGYAIIWIEFLLVWSLFLIHIYRSSTEQISMWKDGLWFARLPIVTCLFALLFCPQYAVLTIYEKPLWAFMFFLITGSMILLSIWIAGLVRKPRWLAVAIGAVLFAAFLLSFGGSLALAENRSIVNRAHTIAGTDPNELLLKETVSGVGAVFSATQNGWYMNENQKVKRVFEPGIYKIQAHSNRIVQYKTQLNDVLVSRFLVLEVSILFPILFTFLLALVFVLVCVRRDASHRHKILATGVALFLLIEATYVLLCNFNLSLFVGQDFSLLSGKVKLLLEVSLLAFLTYPCEADHEEESEELSLSLGAEKVCSPAVAKLLIVVMLITSGLLYAITPLEKGTTPTAFSGRKALAQVQKELAPLNELLKNSNVPKRKLHHGEDVSQLWALLTDSIDLELATAGMSTLGKSMVILFDQELKMRNKADTLIFLSLDPKAGYQLKVNEYQWIYELPNFKQQRWHGSIFEKYATPVEVTSTSNVADIPEGWQPKKDVAQEHQYRKLVRSLCINGKDKTYYSLRDPWLRTVVSAADYSLKGKEDVTLTLDASLQERINDWLRRSCNTPSSVVVVDGAGEVLVLSQNDPSVSVDPNDEAVFVNQRNLRALGGKEEESLLKNLNLDVMNPGVGSSIKPITAACAISMLGLRFDQFRIQSLGLSPNVKIREEIRRNDQSTKKYYQTWRFGACRFSPNWPFESLVNDETGGEDGEVSFTEFLAKSSNYYHATLLTMLLGNGGNIEDLFHDATDADIPQVRFGPYRLGLNGTSTGIKDSYISYCLEENFGFGNTQSHDDFLGPLTTERTKKLYPLTYPRCPVLNEMALQQMTPATRLQRLCTGSIEAYNISPLQMAELYGKIASGHSDFTCSLVSRNKQFHNLFRNYRGEEDSLISQGFRNYLFPAMRECCHTGTASKWHLDNLWQHIYAKTGTLGTTGGREDDRMLAVILADRALETAEPGEAKFVVVYFRFKNHPLSSIDRIVREIIHSRSFNEYMTSNN